MKFSVTRKFENYFFAVVFAVFNAVNAGDSYGKLRGNDSVFANSERIPRANSGRPNDFLRDTPFYKISAINFDSDSSGDTLNSIREKKERENSLIGAEKNVVIQGRLIDFNDTEEGFFLGYSNNVFDVHTKYIENKKGDPDGYYTPEEAAGRGRRKRSVLHLYNMVLCATGCNPLSYKGYGCYCGFLGSGYVVDGIDRCCKLHDWCYDTAGCPMFLEYFIPYMWQCYNHHYPICVIDHGEFGGRGSCAQKLCECDRELAQCLKMYPCPRSKALCTSSPWRLLQNLLMN